MNVALFLEIKNEYTEHLVDTLTPYIYEGLSSIYKKAVELAKESDRDDRTLLIFQKLLQSVNSWNQLNIEEETNRIKQLSNTADYLDDLVKAVIKSNVILLAYSNSISNMIGQTFYNGLTTSTFIHRCYTECAKDAHNNPYLFFHDVAPMDFKRNQIIIQQHVQSAIVKAIRKILPISMILKEYLINSINIINEPPKVELMGMPAGPMENIVPVDTLPKADPSRIASEKKLNPGLEKEVMKIIRSEGIKSDKEKIQAIMNIDKLITSMEPNRQEEFSSKRVLSSISKHRNPELMIAPHLLEQDDNNDDDAFNANLGPSDRKVINIDFDAQPTVEGSTNKKTLSGTSMSGKPAPKYTNANRMYTETSERIDPNKVNLIEDYGPQVGGSRRSRQYKN